tara:strand:- start:3852 stop:4958 length:1107 start_codon:yes stop_codon:yes gene_type:complete
MWILLPPLVIVFYLLLVRLTHPFWSKQPVYHHSDIWLWLTSGKIINENVPIHNSFVSPLRCRTTSVSELGHAEKEKICDFIGQNYSARDRFQYKPGVESLFPYISDNNAYVASWYDRATLGVLTSRPLNAYLPGIGPSKLNYVDNLTVHVEHRKKGIAPRLIQSYLSDIGSLQPDLKIHFFKREGETNPIVPATNYITEFYDSEQIVPSGQTVSTIDDNDLHPILTRLKQDLKQHKMSVSCPETDILRLIEAKCIYALKFTNAANIIESVLFVRDVPTQDKEGRGLLEVYYILPVAGQEVKADCFSALISGLFLIRPDFVFSIERIGRLCMSECKLAAVKPHSECPMSYFFYNYATQTMSAEQAAVFL